MEENKMTREQAHKAAFYCGQLIEHSAVAWYTDAEQQKYHLGYVEREFRKIADALGFIVTPRTVVTMEAAE
jgi:hypothetical protein